MCIRDRHTWQVVAQWLVHRPCTIACHYIRVYIYIIKVDVCLSPYLSALDFRILDFGVYFKLGKKSSSKPTWFFFEFQLDFYCLCSLQKSISKSNWFFSFLNLIFWNWKKFEWHSISQKSSGDRQGVRVVHLVHSSTYRYMSLVMPTAKYILWSKIHIFHWVLHIKTFRVL